MTCEYSGIPQRTALKSAARPIHARVKTRSLCKGMVSLLSEFSAMTCFTPLIILHLHGVRGTFPERFPAESGHAHANGQYRSIKANPPTPVKDVLQSAHPALAFAVGVPFRLKLQTQHHTILVQPGIMMKPLSMFGLKVVGRIMYGPAVFSLSSTSTQS